jgi:hypothetical protein
VGVVINHQKFETQTLTTVVSLNKIRNEYSFKCVCKLREEAGGGGQEYGVGTSCGLQSEVWNTHLLLCRQDWYNLLYYSQEKHFFLVIIAQF